MAHEVETMAYAYDSTSNKEEYQHPWHIELTNDRSVPVSNQMSASEMLKKAGLDWTVKKAETYIEVDGEEIPTGQYSLYRTSDKSILTPNCGKNWHATQPQAFADFFTEFCAEGSMEMNTMGSLLSGKRLFALAKVKGSEFSLFHGKDVIESYFLFSNPFIYGKSLDLSFTPTRVVCMNTLSLALQNQSRLDQMGVRVSHRTKFDPEIVKETLGIAQSKMTSYKEAAEFLASKRTTVDAMKEYYATIFPKSGETDPKKLVLGRPAKLAMEMVDEQPGADLGAGTWWSAYNAATYTVDHKMSRTEEVRKANAWFGSGKTLKIKALNKALEFAEAA